MPPTPDGPIKVAVVEDDAEFRTLVRDTLGTVTGISLIAECVSAESALADLPGLALDVILMDIRLPGLSGIECVRRLKGALPNARFMMLTVFEDYDGIFDSLRAGATGYLIKREVNARLVEAVRELNKGESPISPAIARKLVQEFQNSPAVPDPTADLSARELQVLQALARGRQYKEIAHDLGVSFNTIRSHANRIYEKLQVHSRNEAVGKLGQATQNGTPKRHIEG